jgi:penicillin G amidase
MTGRLESLPHESRRHPHKRMVTARRLFPLISPKAVLKTDMDPVKLLRIFTVIPVVLILLAGAGALWIYFFVLSLLPEGQSVVDTPGISAEVRVVRDRHGIPGIIAEKEEDLALVLGYVMAQDRLWQIDYLRRAGQGRLAEIMGPDYLPGDILMRTVKAGFQGEDFANHLNDRERRWLDQFVQGINRYILSRSSNPPVEFSLLEYRPALFSAEDVGSICLALAWESSLAARIDPVMVRILGRLGNDRGRLLLPTDPSSSGALICADLTKWNPTGLLFPGLSEGRGPRLPGLRGGAAWAVNGDQSASRRPMTACSLYQKLSAPGFWYRARLTAKDFQLSGAFIPGVPAAIVGNNHHLNWGCIAAPIDDADLYVELVDHDAPKAAWRVDRWRRMREVRENFRIRGGSSESHTVHITDTGPIVSDVHMGRALSLRWTGREGSGLFAALCRLNRASSGDEVAGASQLLTAPCLNVVWADSSGNCGIQTAGRVPIRTAESDGIVPMPAWTGVHDWRGFVPFAELPCSRNPASGVSVVSDGRPGGAEYPFFLGCYWNDDSRDARTKQLLGETTGHYRDSFQKMQNDTLSPLARDLTPKLLAALERAGKATGEEEQAIRILSAWDCHMGSESAGAAIFALFYHALLDDLFLKPLGEQLYAGFTGYYPLPGRVVRRVFLDNEHHWLAGADPTAILINSFRRALTDGKSLAGADVAKWQWGELHQTVFRHPIAARSRFLEALYHVGPVRMPGSDDSIQFAASSEVQPFRVLEGVSLRQVAEMTDPPQVFAVAPMGSSAHFFSTHYKGDTRAWLEGRFFQDPVDATDIRKTGGNSVLFKPVVGALTAK